MSSNRGRTLRPARLQRQGKPGDGPPASTPGPNASTTGAPAPEALQADFERAVSEKDWAKAATLLNGCNDAELPKKAEWLTPEDREAVRHATPEALHRVRGALLVANFKAAVQSGQWGTAAENLNGLDDAGIDGNIRTLDTPGRANLYVGALNAMTGGSRDRITSPIARIDLAAAYQAVVRPPAALAQIAANPAAPRGAYAYFQAAGGFTAPTMFSFATAPHIVGMLQDALGRLQTEMQHELTIQALFLAGSVIANFASVAFARNTGSAKPDPKGPSRPTPPTAGKPGSVGAMR